MKTKVRKASAIVAGAQVCPSLNRSKKACHHLGINNEVAELMTSSTPKCRFVCISSSRLMPGHESFGGKRDKNADHTREAADDACQDLRLTFSSIDLPSIDQKVAIPVVPTIRVVITFIKFEELPPSEELCTPPSSPVHLQDLIAKESQNTQDSSNSWFQWIKGSHIRNTAVPTSPDNHPKEVQDPFSILSDYTWTTIDAKKRQMKEKKSKTRKGKRSNDITDNGAER